MKPTADMTADEVNREILELKGWQFRESRHGRLYCSAPHFKGWRSMATAYAPDYCFSWAAAGELLVEMAKGLGNVSLSIGQDGSSLVERACGITMACENDPLSAIARAWLAWRRTHETDI